MGDQSAITTPMLLFAGKIKNGQRISASFQHKYTQEPRILSKCDQ